MCALCAPSIRSHLPRGGVSNREPLICTSQASSHARAVKIGNRSIDALSPLEPALAEAIFGVEGSFPETYERGGHIPPPPASARSRARLGISSELSETRGRLGGYPPRAARTIATMPARSASGRSVQASATSARSGGRSEGRKWVAFWVAVGGRIGSDGAGCCRLEGPSGLWRKWLIETVLDGFCRVLSRVAAEGLEPPTRGL
ncbi:hypothetical protein BH23PLA1_BH23PLA1_35620 [soil metagenome]